ncbi:sigma D regulator [Agaribacterium haliotis]|uniref:sigma D regulator n=1 Tax=Agaribacterium haliotis TaxID=2013869 RepID=UPI000BB5427E|nr:sigma D regulator [Agaribacterium haliotis]
MLENCKNAQERWGGVSEIIDRWLEERQQLLVDYCFLSESVEELDNKTCGSKLTALCEILVDYISAGHFEIYDQLVKEGQELNDTEGLKAAGLLYKDVDKTTEFILDFNDKYQETDDLDAIENDLSRLGEVLATRFEAEDQMIEVLHYAHQDQIEQNA